MSNLLQLVNELRRPRLLLKAMSCGLHDYRRARVLRRLLGGGGALPGSRGAVSALLALEEAQEAARRAGDASYSPARHVETLVALVSEARLLSAEPARCERARSAETADRPLPATRTAAVR